ncbi:hypothetical protein ABB37_05121 [Leptomonas pyrrhocoris]|uniref:Uncharacterized protein n=1 Tax=Leptomonas pyrrhocoris TaxID=157538 RepID=A0A0N0VF34_LEPPY|nr:hypothetical protein ABB37_05121 [Leptomonas pyrrhocoris]KPA80124.1 hypothetical protein ABB37_05121 [Leptomonas pyrrhocoris]|eukprot:XP_015658563.1 hypothetical protein ABB37_05121 [Leptomonas pyrrhocoris]
MKATSYGHGAYHSLEDLRGDCLHICDPDYSADATADSVVKRAATNHLKEANNAFVLGFNDLTTSDGNFKEVQTATDKAANLEKELAALLKEKARLQATCDARKAAQASMLTATPEETAAFVPYAKQLSEFHEHLSLCHSVFKAVLTKSVEDIRDEKLSQQDQRFTEPRSWAIKRDVLYRSLEALRKRTRELGLPVSTYMDEDEDLYREVKELGAEAAEHVRQGESMRAERDEKLKVFYAECAKLTAWCRQQLVNLEAMQEPDHVQEYCATLVENYPTMSNNFSVLLDSVREFVQANMAPVHAALLEAEEVWLYLQVSSLERLSKTLYEIHPKSPLDVEVDKYAGYPEHAAKFLQDLDRFVQAQRNGTVGASELDALQKGCDEVRTTLTGEFAGLPKEVHSFAQRAHALRQGYQCFREAVLSRLTYISPATNVVVESKRRQDEFEDSVRELKTWAAEASRGESWRDIYSKISEIKSLIKSEQDAVANKRERTMGSTGVHTPRSARTTQQL